VISVVGPDSPLAECFTKSYGRYTKGSGSVVATANLHLLEKIPSLKAQAAHMGVLDREGGTAITLDEARLNGASGGSQATSPDAPSSKQSDGLSQQTPTELLQVLRSLQLRAFTPGEAATLHGFPRGFRFPKDVTLKQRYALVGNSLSVDVVAKLLLHLAQ